eukprot:502268-Pleurochrysis_carterae.AAC.1
MADERQPPLIRRERAGNRMGESNPTKPSTGRERYRHEHSEELRCAPHRPRVGQLWTLEVPLQGCTQAEPIPSSQGECDQCTRGRARALAGPEPAVESGRNRLKAGKLNRHKVITRNHSWPMLIKLLTLSIVHHASATQLKNTLHFSNTTCIYDGSNPAVEPERGRPDSKKQGRCMTKADGNHSWIKRNALSCSLHTSPTEQEHNRHLLTRKNMLEDSIPVGKLSRHKFRLEAGKRNGHKPTTRNHSWP